MKTLVKVVNWLLVALGVLLSIHALTRQRTGPNLYRAVNHEVTGLDNSSQSSFSYVVFSDPQFGLLNIVDEDGDGTAWPNDMVNMRHLAARINALHPRPSFVFITGDLSNAYPESPRAEIPGRDDHVLNGFKSPYRTPQTVDLLDALTLIDGEVPVMVNAGNHDMMEHPDALSVGAFEHVWGDSYYTFWSHGRFFISLETQFFRTTESTQLLNREMEWLEQVFASVEAEMPKTVLMHVPLFIDNVNETDSDKEKAIPLKYRHQLLSLFCANNVNLIFSGHTHMSSMPAPYNCPSHQLRQIILTSVNAQLDWQSQKHYYPKGQPGYMVVGVSKNVVQHQTTMIDL